MTHPVQTSALETRFLTEDEVAERLGMKARGVRGLRSRRQLPALKIGKNVVRYDPAAVRAFIWLRTISSNNLEVEKRMAVEATFREQAQLVERLESVEKQLATIERWLAKSPEDKAPTRNQERLVAA